MCKVIMMTNSKKINASDFKKLTHESSKLLRKYERDGFGVSTPGFSQRYVKPKDVRPDLLISSKPFAFENANQDGTIPTELHGGILLHGRTSTNKKSLLNTHPINKHGWSLIHNGVVDDNNVDYKMITSNDTEHCLERLVQGIDKLEKHISGYYVLGALDNDNRLHIVRDSTADLYVTWCETIESYIFATTEELIEDLAEIMKWKIDTVDEVFTDIYLIFDQDGKLVHQQKIKPLGYDMKQAKKASLSLGYDLSVETDSEVDSEYLFLEEIYDSMDHTYTVINKKTGKKTPTGVFMDAHDTLKVTDYLVIRPDGTICSATDYDHETIYEGSLL